MQHLEFDVIGDAAMLGEQVGEGDVEEVVSRNAQAQRRGAVGAVADECGHHLGAHGLE